MTVLLRFADLKKRGLVNSWPQLKRLQTLHGFPVGIMLSANVRAWPEDQVDRWLADRPTKGPPPRGGAGRRRKRMSDDAEGMPDAVFARLRSYAARLAAVAADTRLAESVAQVLAVAKRADGG
jgi:hypothetical protein